MKHKKRTSLSVGYRSIEPVIGISNASIANAVDSLDIRIRNLNGEDVDVPMTVRIVGFVSACRRAATTAPVGGTSGQVPHGRPPDAAHLPNRLDELAGDARGAGTAGVPGEQHAIGRARHARLACWHVCTSRCPQGTPMARW
ncbi:MAG: hypothetical protein R2818_02650 [Flavobacteriales bacterium]